jgi:hypothetical protein
MAERVSRLGQASEPHPDVFTTKGTRETKTDRKQHGLDQDPEIIPFAFVPFLRFVVHPIWNRARRFRHFRWKPWEGFHAFPRGCAAGKASAA